MNCLHHHHVSVHLRHCSSGLVVTLSRRFRPRCFHRPVTATAAVVEQIGATRARRTVRAEQ